MLTTYSDNWLFVLNLYSVDQVVYIVDRSWISILNHRWYLLGYVVMHGHGEILESYLSA